MKIWPRAIFAVWIFLAALGKKVTGNKQGRRLFLFGLFGSKDKTDEALEAVKAKLEKKKMELFELRQKIHLAHGELKSGIIDVAEKLRDLNLDSSRESFDLWDQASDLDVNNEAKESEPPI